MYMIYNQIYIKKQAMALGIQSDYDKSLNKQYHNKMNEFKNIQKIISIIMKIVNYYVQFVMKYNLKVKKIKHTNYLKLGFQIIHYVI